jgi:hypothetical protein
VTEALKSYELAQRSPVDVPGHRGLRRGSMDVPKFGICTWAPDLRRKLVQRHIDGAPVRDLEKQFPAGRSAINTHLRVCEIDRIHRLRFERYAPINWQDIMDDLLQASQALVTAVTDAASRADMAAMTKSVEALLSVVRQRADLAQRVQSAELRQLRDAFGELAAWATLRRPGRAILRSKCTSVSHLK